MSDINGTKLSPQGVFQVVGVLPKTLQDDFRAKCWLEEKQEEAEFVPDPVLKYDHSAGLTWLSENNIPNTLEGLETQREIVFKTMISGAESYNVGQFIVLFPELVYHSKDLGDTIMVVEVMDELEFPAEVDLVTSIDNDIRYASDVDRAAFAVRAALQAYLPSGKIKIHQAGMRMYAMQERYKFETRYTDPEEPKLSFRDAVRRHRKNL